MTAAALREYESEIERAHRAGNATEHTFRPALKALLEAVVPGAGITATNEPKRVACGAPDYVISRGTRHGPLTTGYVEAKDIGLSLNEVERSDQLHRYLGALNNLVLTDYLEFRWYVNGERRLSARLGSVNAQGRLVRDHSSDARVLEVLDGFLARSPEPIRSPKELAERMASLAHIIHDMTVTAFVQGAASSTLRDIYKAFRDVLVPDLTEATFADMFAQTLTYGLFAARCNHPNGGTFSRFDAAREVPRTNPFLRKLFGVLTGPELDDQPFVGFVDDLTQLLRDADLDAILAQFGKHTRTEDPIVHFYETFLSAYDPKLRELRGVYYTPEPVVSYIVRSVDHVLRKEFACLDGLADRSEVTYTATTSQGTREQQSHRVLLMALSQVVPSAISATCDRSVAA